MIGAIAGAGMQVIGGVANAILGARQAAKRRRELADKERNNTNWYNRRYNEVGTERADAKAALTAMREAQQQRVANAQGRSAVMGGSSAVGAVEKQAANQALGNTVASINAQQAQRKDAIETQYNKTRDAISDARSNIALQTQQGIASAVTGASAGAAQMFGTMGSGSGTDSKTTATKPTKLTDVDLYNREYFNDAKWWK